MCDDFAAKQRIAHRFGGTILIPEKNALAALEVMGRFAVDPRWLVYLPPTMAACPSAPEGPFLERPREAIDYCRARGVEGGKDGVVDTRTGEAVTHGSGPEAVSSLSIFRQQPYRAFG